MPAALERSGGAVALPIAEAVIHALKEARASTAEGLADAFINTIAEVLADPEALADPEVFADSEVFPHSEILADPEILPDPQTHSSPET